MKFFGDEELIEESISKFFTKAQFTSTYKILLFKSILKWIENENISMTKILNLDFISRYFIDVSWKFYKFNLKQLTTISKEVETYKIFNEKVPKEILTLTKTHVEKLLPEFRRILLKDVIYRFRNDTLLYDFCIIDENNNISINPKVPDLIDEEDFKEIRPNVSHLVFYDTTYYYLKKNQTILNKALNFLLISFLEKINLKIKLQLSEIIDKI